VALIHQQQYSNSYDELRRYEIYEANLDLIEKHNNIPGCSYQMAMNQFGDMSLEEFVSWFGRPRNQTSVSKLACLFLTVC
jgi:hypothetical protein